MKEKGIPINENHYFKQLETPLMSLLEPVFGGKKKTHKILCLYSTNSFLIYILYTQLINLIFKTNSSYRGPYACEESNHLYARHDG